MNTGKILMIIGGILLGTAGITYLLLLQADRRVMAEVTDAKEVSARPSDVDSRASDHMTGGIIDRSNPSGAITNSTAIVQQPMGASAVPALAIAPAPMASAPKTGPATPRFSWQQKPQAQSKEAPSTAVASVDVQQSAAPKVMPARRLRHGRDGLDSHVTTIQSSTAETDELVKESAKLDPSLPPPDVSAARAALDQRNSKPGNSLSPVAAAMTDQLVRESTKLGPSPLAK
jgi:hypothetical protein